MTAEAPRGAGRRKRPDGDDGRVIAPMDAAGMPWRAPAAGEGPAGGGQGGLTPSQLRQAIAGALSASLLLVGILSAVIVLFVLFCTEVWLR